MSYQRDPPHGTRSIGGEIRRRRHLADSEQELLLTKLTEDSERVAQNKQGEIHTAGTNQQLVEMVDD